MSISVRTIYLIALSATFPIQARAEDFTNAIHAYLQQRVEVEKKDVGIVIGLVDEHCSSILSCGKMDNGTDQPVNGDTLFEIGSFTKTFTTLLLQDLVERGEMKLDDPVAKYLPKSVKMPTRHGKKITLLQLATHTSGLPIIPDNLDPRHVDNPYADYTVEKLYAFLSRYNLTRDPGAKYEYSNLGFGLLGHAIALKGGTNYESLVVDRICRPLKLESTRITLTPDLNARFAQGHNAFGQRVPSWDLPILAGAGALRSTANDLLRYVTANLGLEHSDLTPLMEKTHETRFHESADYDIGLAWEISRDHEGAKIVWKTGGTAGCRTFVGLNKARRRGVVVLSNSQDFDLVYGLGNFLLESEWQSNRRRTEANISKSVYGSYVGLYQHSPDFPLRMRLMRKLLLDAPKTMIYLPVSFCLAVLVAILWRAGNCRRRWITLGCAVLASGLLAALVILVLNPVVSARFRRAQPGIEIRREGDRLFVRAMGLTSWPIDAVLPPTDGELLPESDTRFFERLNGTLITFSRDVWGKASCITIHYHGNEFTFDRVPDQQTKTAHLLEPHVADICSDICRRRGIQRFAIPCYAPFALTFRI